MIVKAEEELRSGLSHHQKELLEEIIEHMHDMSSYFSETAFETGIRFATSYLIEAFDDKQHSSFSL